MCHICKATRLLMLALILPFFLLGVALWLSSMALAQTTVSGAGLYEVVRPYLLEIVGVLAAAIVAWIADLVRRKLGLEIEQKHRDALQTALKNAAGLAIAKGGVIAEGQKFSLHSPLMIEAVKYVEKAAPDALKYFGISPESVAEKIAAKLGVMKAVPDA